MDSNVITVIAVAISGIATQSFNVYRERRKAALDERNRKWDIEDRATAVALAAEHVRLESEKNVEATRHQTAEMTADANSRQDTILTELRENTSLSANAFSASNDINTKLLKIYRRMDQVDDALRVATAAATADRNATATQLATELAAKLQRLTDRIDELAGAVNLNTAMIRPADIKPL